MISAQLAVTSPSSGYTQDGTIFLYENTPVTINLVGTHWEKVTKVKLFRRNKFIRTPTKTIFIRFANYQNKTLLVLR